MTPLLAVILQSEAFHEQWSDLVTTAGGRPLLVQSVEELGAQEVCGVVVAAGGVESAAADVLKALPDPEVPAVVVGVEADYRLGIRLMQGGASDYFVMPRDLSALHAWVVQRVEQANAAEAASGWVANQREQFDFSRLLGESAGLRQALERAARIIPRAGATVLITGETGTGKDALARAIHYNGPRAQQPIVEVNCTALPGNLLEAELFGYERGAFTDARTAKAGLFEVANGGTLFLDEIGDLPIELQGKLLRALQDRRVRRLGSVRDVAVDIRVIAATNIDLPKAVRDGRFRGDLFHRLNVAPLYLPPLRERGHDVLILAEHFLDGFSKDYQMPRPEITPEIRRALLAYPWPGNVRELRNSLERAMLFGDGTLRVEDLFFELHTSPAPTNGPLPFPASLDTIQRAAAQAMLQHCHGNKTEAARALGISRKHLYTLLRETGTTA